MRGASIDQDAFERLLAWLDSDRERAGEKYELLYTKLVALFGWWSCAFPEELADQTLDRTAALLETAPSLREKSPMRSCVGWPASYSWNTYERDKRSITLCAIPRIRLPARARGNNWNIS
jgi:hypothetical protein